MQGMTAVASSRTAGVRRRRTASPVAAITRTQHRQDQRIARQEAEYAVREVRIDVFVGGLSRAGAISQD
jgi:hypothetical protein